jgi:acrylyl-CoA reductase (NADPH)
LGRFRVNVFAQQRGWSSVWRAITSSIPALADIGAPAALMGWVQQPHGLLLVTGATGGVGSVATMLLSGLGHRVVAATGKLDQADYLTRMGAAEVIDRAELSSPGKPFQKERWTAVVDSVGSHTLANALAQTRRGGTVIACGLAQGSDLPTTVMPFILRGVTLAGVDSVMAPLSLRREAWDRLAQEVDRNLLEDMVEDIALDDCVERARDLMDGRVRGRLVVKV